ncbi:class I adenylate-forming enzyme family protein [Pedococcus sp. NPDC057267]|uniref:class I adenylate-forming enzyme family protein n=1 Tax=Pedococcus sp. NPDC057267 TaxID=3346077 RepID=UPI00363EE05A
MLTSTGVRAGIADERPFSSIPEALAHWASVQPDAVAVDDGTEVLTYGDLKDRVEKCALRLRALAVHPGERVVIVGHNSVVWVVAYLSVLHAGAVVAPANNRLSPAQFAQQVDLLDARLVLHDADHRHLAEDTTSDRRLALELASLAHGTTADERPPSGASDPDAPALISFTSGTTGLPKGAVLTSSALFAGSAVFADYLSSSPADSTLVLVPLFHNTGFVDQLGHMLVCGGRTNLLPKFRTADATAALARQPVTFVTAVPSIIRLLMVAEGADEALSHARVVLFGGSPMPAAWSQELMDRWAGLRLVHGYGLTEFTSACSFLPHEYMLTDGESVGFPAPDVELRITDDTGSPAPAGHVGEVWVAGPTRMSGYWRQPELTAAKTSGAWLRTGDLGFRDERGLLWLTGRVDDIINRGGEKVLPAFVESCLADVPAIAQAAVFGVEDPILQHRIAAAIELRAHATFDEVSAVRQLASRLPDYAVPEQWYVVETLPRTASGKVDRRAARQLLSSTLQENP